MGQEGSGHKIARRAPNLVAVLVCIALMFVAVHLPGRGGHDFLPFFLLYSAAALGVLNACFAIAIHVAIWREWRGFGKVVSVGGVVFSVLTMAYLVFLLVVALGYADDWVGPDFSTDYARRPGALFPSAPEEG